MIRTGSLLALIGAAGVSIQAMAVDLNRPVSPRRQLTVCMNRQMSASKTISYNQATAVCKAQLKAKAPTLASSIQAVEQIVEIGGRPAKSTPDTP